MKNHHDPQVQAARRILAELGEIAEHSTLTGSLSTGIRPAAQAFNGALENLRMRGLVPEGMFEPMDPNQSDFGQLGVQCRLLLAATAEEKRDRNDAGLGEVIALAPFLGSQDLATLVRERMGESSRVPEGFLTALAPFLDSSMLGELVRRQMRQSGEPAPAPKPEPAPTPPTPPSPSPEAPVEDWRPVVQDRHPERLETLAEELRRPDLTVEDRQRIATRLAELAYEQSSRSLE